MSEVGSPRPVEEFTRCQDRDVAKGVEHEQVGIAADNARGTTSDGEFEELIILRTSAFPDEFGDFEVRGIVNIPRQEPLSYGLAEIATELRTPNTSTSSSIVALEART